MYAHVCALDEPLVPFSALPCGRHAGSSLHTLQAMDDLTAQLDSVMETTYDGGSGSSPALCEDAAPAPAAAGGSSAGVAAGNDLLVTSPFAGSDPLDSGGGSGSGSLHAHGFAATYGELMPPSDPPGVADMPPSYAESVMYESAPAGGVAAAGGTGTSGGGMRGGRERDAGSGGSAPGVPSAQRPSLKSAPLVIHVTDPVKREQAGLFGFSSGYVVYLVTSAPTASAPAALARRGGAVRRRFKDFVALADVLKSRCASGCGGVEAGE
eukprot:365134-Chlamydomonas_euryale.AAC.10